MSFFFSSRRRHTRLQGDWSSDVCSSDLSIFAKFSTLYKFYALYLAKIELTLHPQRGRCDDGLPRPDAGDEAERPYGASTMNTSYDILGVPRSATEEAIRAAFHSAAKV